MILLWHPLCRYSSPLAVPTAMPRRAAHPIAGDASSWRLAETEPRPENSKTR
uniref:Uncharacterized protein n=1 Tax=Arundo donax TaxID=35708 RepID=A0A0A8XSU5_ARUDO